MDDTQSAVRVADTIRRGAPEVVRKLLPKTEPLARRIRHRRDPNNAKLNKRDPTEIEFAREFQVTSSQEPFLIYDSRTTGLLISRCCAPAELF
jgi:hypothetical protein